MSFYAQTLILIAALLPTYLIRFSLAGIPTTLLEVAIWAAALFGASQPAVRRSYLSAAKTIPTPILFSVALFLLSGVISTLISPHPETSLRILKAWIITPILYAFIVYTATHYNLLTTHRIFKALILSGLVVALLGLSQLGQLDRIRGPYDVPNSLALYLAPIIILAIFSASTADPPKWRAYSRFSRFAAFIMFMALLFTQSLAGILSVLVVLGLSLCFGYWKLKPVWILCFGFCALVATLVLLPKVNYLLQPNSSAAVRLQLWSVSWELIQEHPLLGIGLGTFEPTYQQKLHERFLQPTHYHLQPIPEFVFRDPHNWILSFWLNTGLLGLLSFIALHVYIFYWSFRHWDFIGHWSLGFGISAALIVLLLFGLVDTIYWKNDLSVLHWLIIALSVIGYAKVSTQDL